MAVIPDATGLPEADLQKIAREFNFSETTFVFAPKDPKNTARVRIFTPVNEIPFAGHPTIGTAIAIAQTTGQTDLVLELGVGPIHCKIRLGTPPQAEFTTHVPLAKMGHISVGDAAACLGIAPDHILTVNHRPEIASVGLPFTLVELKTEAALAATFAATDSHRQAEQKYANGIDLFAIFAYVRHGAQIKARMFAPLSNVPEDPATGSAAAALASYLTGIGQSPLELAIEQGVAMGRPSTIYARTTLSDQKCDSVTIGGAAVKTLTGEFCY